MGEDVNRWLLMRLAGTGPDTKGPRIWKGKCKWGKLAGRPREALGLALLLLGVLHLINDSVQDGLSCWKLAPFSTASSRLLAFFFFC